MVKGTMGEQEIDFVITWVDGSDEAWARERRKYRPGSGEDGSEERYRDWGLLRYWFRGVERYAPWVRKIHFITWGHLPEWLDVRNPRLHIVRHEDYVPEEFLPTFNSNVLELHLHRIDGLSERFVYFNDDMFLVGKVGTEVFFRGGKPCDMLALQPVVANPANPVMSHLYLNNSLVLSRHFDKREGMRRHPWAYWRPGYPLLYFCYNLLELAFPLYTGFYTVHGPMAFCKSVFREVWGQEEELLRKVSANRFRSNEDVTPYLFREWQKLAGGFSPRNAGKGFRYFEIGPDNRKLAGAIAGRRCRMVCINDTWSDGSRQEIQSARVQIQSAFERILPGKSGFELG